MDNPLNKIPLIGRKKESKKRDSDGNGHMNLTQKDMEALQEMMIQVTDQRMAEIDSRRGNIGDEDFKDLRKYLYETPRSKMRQLCQRSERSAALDPQVYGISYLTSPSLFFEEGWGMCIVESKNELGKRKLSYHTHEEHYVLRPGEAIIGYTRVPGDLLPFTMQMVEQISRSTKGFLITHTVGLTRMQVESEEDAKHLGSPGA